MKLPEPIKRQKYKMRYRLACAASLAGTAAVWSAEPSTPEALQASYDGVYRVMKLPPATGALIIEFGPGSTAKRDGLQLGDVVTNYNYRHVLNEATLRDTVAEHVAAAQTSGGTPGDQPVPLVIIRGGKEVRLTVPAGPLRLTLLDVTKGIPAVLNPPPTLPTQFNMEWNNLPTLHVRPGELAGHEVWTRLYDTGKLLGYEHSTLDKAGDTFELVVETSLIAGNRVFERQVCDISFIAGDGDKLPPFVLNALGLQGADLLITAQRHGAFIRGSVLEGTAARQATAQQPAVGATTEISADTQPSTEPEEDEPADDNPAGPEQRFVTVAGAVPVYAIPVLAAALPRKAGIAVACPKINELDLHTRLGYTLETLGKRPLRINKTTVQAFAVRLVHFGKIEQTYYFDDARELLYADLGGLTVQRVASEADAKSGLAEPPANLQK